MEVWIVYITFYGEPVPQGIYSSEIEANKHKDALREPIFEEIIIERVQVKDKFERLPEHVFNNVYPSEGL